MSLWVRFLGGTFSFIGHADSTSEAADSWSTWDDGGGQGSAGLGVLNSLCSLVYERLALLVSMWKLPDEGENWSVHTPPAKPCQWASSVCDLLL